MVGGLGVCGRPFCCKEFLDDFQPVSIKMAKTQNLSLNPTKISGTCGRLMCCLKYEQEAYEDLIKTAPKAESFVDTPDGRGTVIEVNLLRQSVKVRMEDHPETIGSYKNTDIYIIRNGKARKNDPPIPKDLAPISSRPRPAQKKKGGCFEELPEVISSGAVAGISPELHEAAKVDGATKLQLIRHIDLPLIMPTATILLIMNCGSILSVGFEKAFLLQNNLNASVSEIISTYVYKVGLINNDMSYSSAIGLFNTIVNMVMLIIVNTISDKLSGNSLW